MMDARVIPFGKHKGERVNDLASDEPSYLRWALEEYFRPDWSLGCGNCGASPVVPLSVLCGPCNFGEAETINGGWWDEQKDEMK